MLLGCPRSGTNFLQDLVNSHPACEVQNEPISMHLPEARYWDLCKNGVVAEALACRCQSCFMCHLRTWLRTGDYRGFKETTLFSLLPDCQKWLPELKIVFLKRDVKEIINSHVRGKLFHTWDLSKSRLYKDYQFLRPHARLELQHEIEDYIRYVTVERNSYWNQYREQFPNLEIDFSDLSVNTVDTLKEVMRFIGLSIHTKQLEAIQLRGSETEFSGSPYGTYGARAQNHKGRLTTDQVR